MQTIHCQSLISGVNDINYSSSEQVKVLSVPFVTSPYSLNLSLLYYYTSPVRTPTGNISSTRTSQTTPTLKVNQFHRKISTTTSTLFTRLPPSNHRLIKEKRFDDVTNKKLSPNEKREERENILF